MINYKKLNSGILNFIKYLLYTTLEWIEVLKKRITALTSLKKGFMFVKYIDSRKRVEKKTFVFINNTHNKNLIAD